MMPPTDGAPPQFGTPDAMQQQRPRWGQGGPQFGQMPPRGNRQGLFGGMPGMGQPGQMPPMGMPQGNLMPSGATPTPPTGVQPQPQMGMGQPQQPWWLHPNGGQQAGGARPPQGLGSMLQSGWYPQG